MPTPMNDDHQSIENKLNAIVTDIDAIRSVLQGSGILISCNLSIGSTKPNVAYSSTVVFYAGLGGGLIDPSESGVALSGSNLPTAKTGAWALDIDEEGVVTTTPAAANATGYASGALALAGIPAVAEGSVRLGTVTVANASGSVFDPGTTNLDAVGLTVTYASSDVMFSTIPAATATLGT